MGRFSGRAPAPRTGTEALALLAALGASPPLIRHHELVLEAAIALTDGLARRLGARFDAAEVQIGAALHDVGKLLAPRELGEPGSSHEQLGRSLLIERGVPEHLARFCVTHGAWRGPTPHTSLGPSAEGRVAETRSTLALEDLLVALADKLWKGRRVEVLEDAVLTRLAYQVDQARWRVFEISDGIYAEIAAGGPERLARSWVGLGERD